MWNILVCELRLTFRQRSSYIFVLLWVVVLSFLFLLHRNTPDLSGYTNMTGTIANIILYMIPLFMLISGSFTIANEMENGQWSLLSTYPISSITYFIGKWLGHFSAQGVIFMLSYGMSLIIGIWSGIQLDLKWVVVLFIFSISLMIMFLSIGLCIGSWTSSRWQALSASVCCWFILIMIWPTALIGGLSLVPYPLIAPLLKLSVFLNPAEFLRIVFVIQLDGGAIFGETYDSLVTSLSSGLSWLVIFFYIVVFNLVPISLSSWRLERRKMK